MGHEYSVEKNYIMYMGSGGASRYSDVWTLVADRYYYYTYLPVDLFDIIICLDVYIYIYVYIIYEEEDDEDETTPTHLKSLGR